MMQTTNPWLFV